MHDASIFGGWSRRTQTRALRALAAAHLDAFGLAGSSLRLIEYSYNATYRVDAPDGKRYAMRINVNSPSGATDVVVETAWVSSLVDAGAIAVAHPVTASTGAAVVTPHFEPLDRPVAIVVYEWLNGPDLGDGASLKRIRALGAAAATLHQHAEQWTAPEGLAIRTYDTVLFGCPDTKNLPSLQPALSAADERIVMSSLERVHELSRPAFAGPKQHIIHADLHPYNAKWVDGAIALFDFDDAGVGTALLDLAISAYYLRDDPRKEQALFEGYASVRELPTHTGEQFEALMAGRNLQMVSDVVNSVNFSPAFIEQYLQTTVRRMRRYLDTGIFDMDS